jgi:hypothetical protein
MNIICTKSYEGDDICSICRQSFREVSKSESDDSCQSGEIVLVKHFDDKNQKSEKIALARKRRHIFHESCLLEYLQELNNGSFDDISTCDFLCPFDREPIDKLISVRYSEIVALNILNFAHNYYELLDKGEINVSIIDRSNINYKDSNGKTLIYCACQRGNHKLVRQLIKLGANPTIADDNGFTPLMATVSHDYIDIVKYLLKISSIIDTINYEDNKGYTAINYADLYCRHECLLELLTVKGLDQLCLKKIFDKYQSIDSVVCREIRKKLRRYLGLKSQTKSDLNKLGILASIGNRSPRQYQSGTEQVNYMTVCIDVDNNPEILNILYKPQTIKSQAKASSFSKISYSDPFQPQKSFSKTIDE